MRNWARFFLGTPQRFLATLVGAGIIICMISPSFFANAAQTAVYTILQAIDPLIKPILGVALVFAAIMYMLRGGTRGRRR